VHAVHEFLAKPQTKAGARRATFQPLELVEDRLSLSDVNAWALVVDLDPRMLIVTYND
jgi:hypothetical protein